MRDFNDGDVGREGEVSGWVDGCPLADGRSVEWGNLRQFVYLHLFNL